MLILYKSYWKYLFEKPFNLRKLLCRIQKHKCGPIWFNPGALEPNMYCKNCGDYLG